MTFLALSHNAIWYIPWDGCNMGYGPTASNEESSQGLEEGNKAYFVMKISLYFSAILTVP